MIKKNKTKYLLFLTFIIIFLLFGSGVHALEIKYPDLTSVGLPDLNSTSPPPSLAQYAAYIFGLLVYVAGALALISFAIGAVSLINPNIEAHNDAKDRMKGAVLGLVLTVVSFIILQTINPVFVSPNLNKLPGVAGVYLTNGSEDKPCPLESSDNSTLPAGFNRIKYVCDTTGPNILIWEFPLAGLEGGNGDLSAVKTVEKKCGEEEDISGFASFKMIPESTGVYYYLDSGCTGYASYANINSQDIIANPFYGRMQGVKIINDPTNNIEYGAILHKIIGLKNGGECSLPITQGGDSMASATCNLAGISSASAADIFKLNKVPDSSSGDGITFYSEPFGWNGAKAGFYELTAINVANDPFTPEMSDVMEFDYEHVNQPIGYQDLCENFDDCPGSIRIKGSYLVALYSGLSYCQTFTKDVENLNTEQIIAAGGTVVDYIYSIPTK